MKFFFVVVLICTSVAQTARAMDLVATVLDENGAAIYQAAIYAEPIDLMPMVKESSEAVIRQVDKMFKPFVSVVRTNTHIRFPNRDNIKHHVYSFSPAKKFTLPLYSGSNAEAVLFDKPGEITLGCNIHDWMIAHVLVVDSPYSAITTKDGHARLSDLPAGEYKVWPWHPGMKGKRKVKPQVVQLTDGDVNLTFEIRLKPRHKWWRNKPADADVGGADNY